MPRYRPLVLLYAIGMLVLAWPFSTKRSSDWMVTFVPTARHLAAGEELYFQPHGFVYPPFQALFALPVLELPDIAQRLTWFAVNAIALWIAIRSAWRLAGGPDLEQRPLNPRELIAAAIGLFIGLTYFLNSLMHHQTDVLLAALIFSGCERLQCGRGFTAATLFGLAAAMKCTPLLFALYLVIRGRFAAAAWLVCVAIGVNLLPDLINSPPHFSCWLAKWWTIFLAPMAAAEHRPGIWASDIIFNQSIIGAVNRWTMTSWTLSDGFRAFLIEPRISPTVMKLSILGSAALLGTASLAAVIRGRLLPEASRSALECSLVLCGMLLFSPMSSPAHFGLLILPAFLLAREALLNRGRASAVMLAFMLAAAYASNKDLLGGTLYSLGLWHASITAGALAAWIGCTTKLIGGRGGEDRGRQGI